MMATITNITNIPAPRVPFTDERTGLISREWYRFLLNLYTLSGGGQSDTSLADLQVGPLNGANTGLFRDEIQHMELATDFANQNAIQALGLIATLRPVMSNAKGAFIHG